MPISDLSHENKTNKNHIVKLGFLENASHLDIILALRNLAIMLKSGMALGDAIKSIADSNEKKVMKKVFTGILYDIQAGKNLTEAMSKFGKIFNNFVLSMVKIGEESGTLEKNLIFLTEYLKKDYELQKKVKGALMYPLIVLGMSMTEMVGVVFFILPKMDELFKAFEDPPATTLFILNFTKFIRTNTISLIAGLVAIIVFVMLVLRTKFGRELKDNLSLKFPIIKDLTQKNILATLARTIMVLLQSGIPIVSALTITANSTNNSLYKKMLLKIEESVRGGENITVSMSKYPKFFPSTFVKMIQVGEATGSLEDNLTYLYEFYAEEVDEMSNNLATLLEPIMLIFIGAMIGLLAVMIIAPIYQLTGTINA